MYVFFFVAADFVGHLLFTSKWGNRLNFLLTQVGQYVSIGLGLLALSYLVGYILRQLGYRWRQLDSPWSGVEAMGILLLYGLLDILPSVFVEEFRQFDGLHRGQSFYYQHSYALYGLLQIVLPFGLALVASLRLPRAQWGAPRWHMLEIFFWSLVAMLLSSGLASVFRFLAMEGLGELMLLAILEEYGAGVLLGLAVVVAPIGEELLFRGVLLSGLHRQLPFWLANAIQALAFAAMHDNVDNFIFLSIFGFIAGLLRYHSGGLGSSMLMHMLNNLNYTLSRFF